VTVIAIDSKFRELEPVCVVGPERIHDLLDEIASGGKLIEVLDRCLDAGGGGARNYLGARWS